MTKRTEKITRILKAAAQGDSEAALDLIPLVYDDLHHLAHARLRKVGQGRTLQTTDLLHESWARLVGNGSFDFENRRHFFGAAARAMRNILVEQARRREALKRESSRNEPISPDLPEVVTTLPIEDVISVSDALEKLEVSHPRHAEVVWQRFFNGLTMEEIAEVLGTSLTTVERDWRFARSWLQEELDGETE